MIMKNQRIGNKKRKFYRKIRQGELKYLLKSNSVFSNTKEISQVFEELIVSINYAMLNNQNLDGKILQKIIGKIEHCLKDEITIKFIIFCLK